MLRRLEPVRRPHRLSEDRDLEHVRLPKHPSSFSGIFEAGSEEGLRATWAVLHQDRVVAERDGQDMGDRAEDGQLLLAEEVDRAGNCGQL
jgi:hypothetical protein